MKITFACHWIELLSNKVSWFDQTTIPYQTYYIRKPTNISSFQPVGLLNKSTNSAVGDIFGNT